MQLLGLARAASKRINNSHHRDQHASNTPHQTTIMTLPPSSFNPEYAAPAHKPRDEPPPPYSAVAPPESRIDQPRGSARTATRTASQTQAQTPVQTPAQTEPQPDTKREQPASPPARAPSQSQRRQQAPTRAPSQSQPRQEQPRVPARKPVQPSYPPTRALPPLPSQSQSSSQPAPAQQGLQRSASVIRHDVNVPSYQQSPSQRPTGYVVVDAEALGVCDCIYRDGFGLAPKCRQCERQARRGHHGTGERRRRRQQREGPVHMIVDEIRR